MLVTQTQNKSDGKKIYSQNLHEVQSSIEVGRVVHEEAAAIELEGKWEMQWQSTGHLSSSFLNVLVPNGWIALPVVTLAG